MYDKLSLSRITHMLLPLFGTDGLLPPGEYALTLEELERCYLVTGKGVAVREWNKPHRQKLVRRLGSVARELWGIGLDRIFVDGSFVTSVGRPRDLDAYVECGEYEVKSGIIRVELLKRDKFSLITLGFGPRELNPATGHRKERLWHVTKIDLYAQYCGCRTGVLHPHDGHDMDFAELFRTDRATGKEKGIVRLAPAPRQAPQGQTHDKK